jgi:hypothetical protein
MDMSPRSTTMCSRCWMCRRSLVVPEVTNMSKSNGNDDEDDAWGSFGVVHVAVPASTSPPNCAGEGVVFCDCGIGVEWTSVTSARHLPSLTSVSASVTTTVTVAATAGGSDD